MTAVPTVDPAQVELTWVPTDKSQWTSSPTLTYTVYRESGTAVETIATDVRVLRHADRGVEPGAAYKYQVDGGEAARSALVTVEVPCAYTVTPVHRDVLWTAATGQVSVATGSNCAWTAASESGFLAATAGAAGTGPGTVSYTVLNITERGRSSDGHAAGGGSAGNVLPGVADAVRTIP